MSLLEWLDVLFLMFFTTLASSYLFTAIAPLTGESFHLMCLDEMSTQTELTFLKELKKEHPDKNVVVVIAAFLALSE